MSYCLEPGESVQEALHRIAGEQIDKALDELDDSDLTASQTVHQVRKRCKKLRALLRLVRPALGDTYRRENRFFRDVARELSELRDAASRIECLDHLIERSESHEASNPNPAGSALRAIRESLTSHRDSLYAADGARDRLSLARDSLLASRSRVDDWRVDDSGFDALGPGFAKTYGRGRKAMRNAYDEGTSGAFHEWRKRAKYHRHHVRLLRNLWSPILEARRRQLHQLSDLLGDGHDLSVMRDWIISEHDRGLPLSSTDVSSVAVLAEIRRSELEALALPLGHRLFADGPRAWKRRARRFWEGWQIEHEPLIAAAVI